VGPFQYHYQLDIKMFGKMFRLIAGALGALRAIRFMPGRA
jgi:hypothetical protein